jgi:hypothetical protein
VGVCFVVWNAPSSASCSGQFVDFLYRVSPSSHII